MKKEYTFSADELESSLKDFSQKGITELFVNDESLANDKKRLVRFLVAVESDAKDVFVSIKVNPSVIDNELCKICAELNCSLEVSFVAQKKTVHFSLIKNCLRKNAPL